MENDRSQDPRGRGLDLRPLDPSIDPPPELEGRVVERLRREHLLGRSRIARWRWVAVAAAVVAAFVAGVLLDAVRGGGSASGATGEGEALYALLLYQGADFEVAGHPRERVEEYRGWVSSLRTGGRLADGERLASRGVVLRGGEGAGVTDAPLVGPDGSLSGFFLIEASDEAEARTIAESCPHLAHGGTVELRRIERGR